MHAMHVANCHARQRRDRLKADLNTKLQVSNSGKYFPCLLSFFCAEEFVARPLWLLLQAVY